MKEIFKEVAGFPDYEISNCGRIRTKKRKVRYVHAITRREHFRETEERFLTLYFNHRTGYYFVQPRKDKKPYNRNIHRLVAETFKPMSSYANLVVNHIDGNKRNNTVDNLEWVTNAYNHAHATMHKLKASGSRIGSAKLNEHSVGAIKWFLAKGLSHSELARAFNISRASIILIAQGVTWKDVELMPQFEKEATN